MAQPHDPRDLPIPNDASNTEPAEGSRDNVNVESGISNRPIREEQEDQQAVPPRGSGRDETE